MISVEKYLEVRDKWFSKKSCQDVVEYYALEDALDEVKAFNKELIEKYPWLQPTDDDYHYNWTWLDNLLPGWYKVFGLQMCEEIQEALDPENDYTILDIKEKYGSLRWYAHGGNTRVDAVIRKYEHLSELICQQCGEPATKMTTGWVGFFCNDCVPKNTKAVEYESAVDISRFSKDTFF